MYFGWLENKITRYKNDLPHLIILVTLTLISCFPVLQKPNRLLEAGDYPETHLPIANFFRESVWKYGEIPLWRGEILSGAPFIGDPLNGIWYPPHLAFLLPLDTTFIYAYLTVLHVLFGGLGMYVFARRVLRLEQLPALTAAAVFSLSPKLFAHLGAGHMSIIEALAWWPWLAISVTHLHRIDIKVIGLSAMLLALVFLADLRMFVYALMAIGVYVLSEAVRKRQWVNWFVSFSGAILGALCLSAIQFLPMVELQSLSTRFLIDFNEVTVNSLSPKAAISMIAPWWNFLQLGPEMFLYLGTVSLFLAAISFFLVIKGEPGTDRRERLTVMLFIAVSILAGLFALGKWSPVYRILYETLSPLQYLRVPTRIWFVVVFCVAALSAYTIHYLQKHGKLRGYLVLIVVALLFVDLIAANRAVLQVTYSHQEVPKEIYEFLSNEEELYRVMSPNHVLSQRTAAEYGIELVDGENPTHLESYARYIKAASGYDFNGYSVVVPPWQVYLNQHIAPDAQSLGVLNTKYVVTTYPVDSNDWKLVKAVGNFQVYENEKYIPRFTFLTTKLDAAGIQLIEYSPNRITVRTQNPVGDTLVLSEIAYPGWVATVNGEPAHIKQAYGLLRAIPLPQGENIVSFEYQPISYRTGIWISFATLMLIVGFFILRSFRLGRY